MAKNAATEKIMKEVQVIIETPMPPAMLDPIKRLLEIILVLQGQIEGLADTLVDQEVKIRSIDKTVRDLCDAHP